MKYPMKSAEPTASLFDVQSSGALNYTIFEIILIN